MLTGDSLFVGDVARPDLAVEGAEGAATLYESLHTRLLSLADLEQVQRRREMPVRLIQTMQVFIHRRINGRSSDRGDKLPFIGLLFRWFPILRRLPARFIGLGPRPEHIHSPTSDL